MPIQSYLMMYFAGAGWQIGKRKISAIPNKEFNKMSANDLLKGFTGDLRETIPTLEASLQDVTPLVRILIEQYGEFMKAILTVTPVVSKDVLFGDQGIFSPTQVGNKALLDDIKALLVGQSSGVTTTGPSATQFSALAFAQIQLQQALDKLNAGKLGSLTPDIVKTTGAPVFQGPEINPATGELSTGMAAILKARELEGAAHIKDRSRSNVSLQSLRLTKADLEFQIRRAAIAQKNALARFKILNALTGNQKTRALRKIQQAQATVSRTTATLRTHQQAFANFMKMHGKRL